MLELALSAALKVFLRRVWATDGTHAHVFHPFEAIPPQTTFPYITIHFTQFQTDRLSGSGYGAGHIGGTFTLWTNAEQVALRTAFSNTNFNGTFSFEKADRLKGTCTLSITPGTEATRKDKHAQTTRAFKLYFEEQPHDALT